jgi:hypothetical protein
MNCLSLTRQLLHTSISYTGTRAGALLLPLNLLRPLLLLLRLLLLLPA